MKHLEIKIKDSPMFLRFLSKTILGFLHCSEWKIGTQKVEPFSNGE